MDSFAIFDALSDTEVLALTIYGEARGESIEGQVAVAAVVRNRVQSGQYTSYKKACLAPVQFSCWNESDSNRKVLLEFAQRIFNRQAVPELHQFSWIARGIIDWHVNDNTGHATNYMTTKLYTSPVAPSWSRKMKLTKVIGAHTFLV